MLLECLIVLFIFIVILIWKRHQKMTLRDRLGIPGPKPNILFGNLLQMLEYNKKYGQMSPLYEKWRKDYGNTYGVYFGPQLMVIVFDLEMAREIMIKQFTNFEDRPKMFLTEREPAVRDMMMNLHGEEWKRVRNSVATTFTTSKLKQMHETVKDKITVFMKKMDGYFENKTEFDIHDDFRAMTLDVIGKCAFAMDVHTQTDKNDLFLKYVKETFVNWAINSSRLIQLCVLFPELDKFLSFFRSVTFGEAEAWILRRLNEVIQARKQIVKEFKSVDVLQVLLEQNQKLDEQEMSRDKKENEPESKKIWKLTDSALQANVYLFLLGGYETTSTALGFTAWLLAKHQDVQKKLQNEIDEIKKSKSPVNYEIVRDMPYMDAVFRESLRYYPPIVQFVNRLCKAECVVQGVKFVPGINVMFLPRIIHHDPEVWSEPELYNPDRFLNAQDIHPMSWLPFGQGPRNCIGMRFADMEYKLCLFNLLSKYNIEFGAGSEDPLVIEERDAVMNPKNGVFIKLTKRNF